MILIRSLLLILITSCSIGKSMDINNEKNYIFSRFIDDGSFKVEKIDLKKEKWSNDQEFIFYINNGKVYKTYGLKNNIEIIGINNFEIQSLKKDEVFKSVSQIKFTNPEANYLEIFYEYKIVNSSDPKFQDEDSYIVEEKYNIPLIRWSGKNYFLIDKKTKAIKKSEQKLSPFSQKIYIVHKKIAA